MKLNAWTDTKYKQIKTKDHKIKVMFLKCCPDNYKWTSLHINGTYHDIRQAPLWVTWAMSCENREYLSFMSHHQLSRQGFGFKSRLWKTGAGIHGLQNQLFNHSTMANSDVKMGLLNKLIDDILSTQSTAMNYSEPPLMVTSSQKRPRKQPLCDSLKCSFTIQQKFHYQYHLWDCLKVVLLVEWS